MSVGSGSGGGPGNAGEPPPTFDLEKTIEREVIEEMQMRPGGETAEAWELESLEGPREMAEEDPTVGRGAVRCQARFWDDYNKKYVDISVNYHPGNNQFGIIKFASGK
jgi:hypothetical protein